MFKYDGLSKSDTGLDIVVIAKVTLSKGLKEVREGP